MSIQYIVDTASVIQKEIDYLFSKGRTLGESDPETWEHLYEDHVSDVLEDYKPDGSAAEAQALSTLYNVTKRVIDEALMPSDLVESFHVFQHQICDVLIRIGEINETVGAQIVKDAHAACLKFENKDVRRIFAKISAKIQKAYPALTLAAENNSSMFAGKTIVLPERYRTSRARKLPHRLNP